MKIIKLQAENVKKIKAVEIKPDGNMVTISGKNGAGKTSVLDSIWFALGGAEAAKDTKRPIRDGEKTAKVVLDLEKIIVTRTWTDKGSYLKIENQEGAVYPSPQALLDKLIGKLSFDPLAFSQMKDRERRETLLGLVKIDLDLEAWATERGQVYETRTVINRKVKETEAQLTGLPAVPEGTPDAEISAAKVLEEQAAAQAVKEGNDAQKREYQEEHGRLTRLKYDNGGMAEEIKNLKAKLADLENTFQKNAKVIIDTTKKLEKQWLQLNALQDPDLTVFATRIAEVEAINRNVRAKQQRANLVTALKGHQAAAEKATSALANLDSMKVEALEAAQFPIEGLAFDDEGVTYKGIPFSQCSSAERLRVSLAMAMALNPKIRVLRITDGSLLDSDNLAVIQEMVTKHDFQLWIERVDDSGQVGVVIEDGMVKSK